MLNPAMSACQARGQDKSLTGFGIAAELIWPYLWRTQVTPGSPGPGNVVLMFSQHPGICCREPGTDPGQRAFSQSCPSVRLGQGHIRHGLGGVGRGWGGPALVQAPEPHGPGGLSQNAMTMSVPEARGAHGSSISMLLFHVKTVCEASPVRVAHYPVVTGDAPDCWAFPTCRGQQEGRGARRGPGGPNAGLPRGDFHRATSGSSCAL